MHTVTIIFAELQSEVRKDFLVFLIYLCNSFVLPSIHPTDTKGPCYLSCLHKKEKKQKNVLKQSVLLKVRVVGKCQVKLFYYVIPTYRGLKKKKKQLISGNNMGTYPVICIHMLTEGVII